MPVKIDYPYFELRFDAEGKPEDAKQLTALIDGLAAKGTTDLFLISHGWNNDAVAAHELYTELFTNVKKQEAAVGVPGRTFAVAGVIWPSKKFDDADDAPNAASLGNGHTRVIAQIDRLAEFVAEGKGGAAKAKSLAKAKALIPKIEKSAEARRELCEILLAFIPKSVGEEGDRVLAPAAAKAMVDDDTLLKQLGSPPPKVAAKGGGATSMGTKKPNAPPGPTFEGAAGLGDLLKGIVAGAASLANTVTYYQMKDRAGTVGRNGVNAALQEIRKKAPGVRVHLVGHSFGCRVVTAAVTGNATTPGGFVHSMSLLQAAFSHYSFSEKFDDSKKAGFFRNLITEKRVSGPIIITHTRADKAVGLAYAVASRAAKQIAAAIGDKNDPFGGLGSNGAQKTAEATDQKLPKAGTPFATALTKGSMTNLLADGLITGHSDVRNQHAAYAVLTAARVAGD